LSRTHRNLELDGWRHVAVDMMRPDDLIVGSAGSTGEVEAISIPSASPLRPIVRLKPPGVASVVPVTSSTAICSGLPVPRGPAILSPWGPSRDRPFTAHRSGQRQSGRRKEADRLACEAWNKRMLGFQGPAQPSPALGDALNAGFGYLEVKCLGCNTHQTVALDIVRRPKATPVHELERYMRCKDCSQVRGYPYKRSHLVAPRPTKITASDPPSTWWPGGR
jgi:hypothetical protein